MAPQLVSFCLAVIVLALSAQAQDLTIVAYIPFQSQVPPVSTPPGLAGFKDRFKMAFSESLQYINDITGQGLGSAPSLKATIPVWVYTEASAQATFAYSEEWMNPIQYLVAAPQTLYYYDNDTSSAGFKLINIYQALPEGTTFDILVASPPPEPPLPTGTSAPPPSPPPPIFPRSPPSPRPPRPPPRPPSPRNNDTFTFVVTSTVISTNLPPPGTHNSTLFLEAFFASFAVMMDCAGAYGNSSIFNSTEARQNSTLILEVCYDAASFNASNTNTTGFPARPASYNATQYLIDDPLYNVSSIDTVGGRRRRSRSLLIVFNQPTTQPGKSWNLTTVSYYDAITQSQIDVYTLSQFIVVNGQKAILVVVLVLQDLVLVQSAIYVTINGVVQGYTPDVPGYSKVGTQKARRLIERHTNAGLVSANNVKWAEVDPSDVAYGTDKSLYEVFSIPTDYYAAGAACSARGAKLASYSSEGAQIFIDILCDGAAGMQCWVEGNADGACSAVSSSSVRPLSCAKQMPFVCVKDKSAITTRTVSSNSESVAELAQSKPSDVAYDTQKNLYEIFSTPVGYHTAGSVCLARGAQLANYGSESAQVFIDVLCEAATGQTCWVEGSRAGRCSMVKASEVHQASCTGLQPFVCTKKASAKKIKD